jgi:hypothetical protein
VDREKSLGVLSDMRRGKSLNQASKERGVSPKRVLGLNVFYRNKHKWMAPQHDNLPRVMRINENGQDVTIVINDSRIASLIGTYHVVVKKSLKDKDHSGLLPFSYIGFTDANGQIHKFETNPETLKQIEKRREEGEFYTIYK